MDSAAIAGAPAAAYHDMDILQSGIETDAKNYTRFFVITRREKAKIYRSSIKINRFAISFSVADEPGSLFHVLEILNENHLNMKKLESRPILGKPWEYALIAEIEIEDEKKLPEILEKIKEHTVSFRLLGTYAAAH